MVSWYAIHCITQNEDEFDKLKVSGRKSIYLLKVKKIYQWKMSISVELQLKNHRRDKYKMECKSCILKNKDSMNNNSNTLIQNVSRYFTQSVSEQKMIK